jgi:hypothetical protein
MRRLRQLIIVAAVLAMALTTIGTPVSAAGAGKVAIVNGFPGRSIDICINNQEIKSGLRYGQTFFRTLPSGPKSLKVYAKDARTCRGQLLASKSFGFPAGSDRTIVMTKFGPRIQLFDNNFGPTTAATPISIWYWRNASDISPVSLDLDSDGPTPSPIAPAADPVWPKGGQVLSGFALGTTLVVITTRFSLADTATTLGEPDARLVEVLFRYEWILIGTNPANARLVVLKRPIPPVVATPA